MPCYTYIVCEDKNLSLVILLDSSLSISDYFDVSKSWISNLLESTAELFEHESDKLSLENHHDNDNDLCLRSSLIIFDHDTKLVWNLDEFDGAYDHEKAKSMLTNAVQLNEQERLSGTHIKDALQYTVDNVFPKMDKNDANIVLYSVMVIHHHVIRIMIRIMSISTKSHFQSISRFECKILNGNHW